MKTCNRILLIGFFLFVSAPVSANEFCIRPIKSISVNESIIDIEHGDGYQRSVMKPEWVNGNIDLINRTLSVLLAAKSTSKSVRFLYSAAHNDTAASCTPSLVQKLIGVTILY